MFVILIVVEQFVEAWLDSPFFSPSTGAIIRMKAAITRHVYHGYVTRLVNYLPHSEVKSSRLWLANPLHENTWSKDAISKGRSKIHSIN